MKVGRGILITLFLTILILGPPLPLMAKPYISSNYYCLVDRASGQTILSQNAHQKRPVASTTKIMTAILAEEYAKLNEIAVVSKNADRTPEYTIGLRTGQKLSIGELIKVSLIRSSNDAAVVLAEHIAGSEPLFAHLMSKKAWVIGAMNTRFKNASGLPNQYHYSTAFDLAQIGRYALSKPYLQEMVASSQVQFQHPSYREPLTLRNTNGLLNSYEGADGIKTGTTDAAGKCLVASAQRSKRGLIAVVLKAGDRNGDCIRLLNYGFNNSTMQKIISSDEAFKSIKIIKGEKTWVDLFPEEDLWLWVGKDRPNIEKKVRLNYHLPAPVVKGYKYGVVDIFIDGAHFTSIDLITHDSISREPGFFTKVMQEFFKWLAIQFSLSPSK